MNTFNSIFLQGNFLMDVQFINKKEKGVVYQLGDYCSKTEYPMLDVFQSNNPTFVQ